MELGPKRRDSRETEHCENFKGGGVIQEAAQEEMVIDDPTRAVGRGIMGSYQYNWKRSLHSIESYGGVVG